MRALENKKYDKDEISAELKNIFNYFDGYRKQYEDKAIEWYKLFVGYIEDREPAEGKSNLHIPKTYEILDTIRARIVMSFFNKRPYVDFSAMPNKAGSIESIMLNKEKADVAAAFVDEQLEKNQIRTVFYDFVTSMLIFPAAFMGVGWRYEEEMVKKKTKVPLVDNYGSYTGQWTFQQIEQLETVYDDNEIFNIDFFDFWGDPDAKEIDDSRGVFHREWVTIDELVNKLELLAKIGEGKVYEMDIDSIIESRKEEAGSSRRLSAIGIDTGGQDPYKNSSDEDLSTKQEVELLHYWEDDRHCIMVNRNEVLYDGPNPYWRHRKKPFIKASYDRLPEEFYGMSAVQIIHHLQEEVNTMHNQRMDNANMLINQMWLRLRGSDISDEDLISRPNGIIDVDSMEDLQPLPTGDIPSVAFASEERINAEIQRVLGTPANVRGAEAGKSQTATEASITAESAGTRFGAKTALFEDLGIKRLALMMDLNNQQFVSDERAARIDPEDRNSWQSIDPGDLIGEFDYSPATSSVESAANKDLRREQLTEIMGFLLQSGVPFVNFRKLVEEWLSEFDIDHPERFMIPEQEYEMIRRQVIEEVTAQEAVPSSPEDIFATAQANTGNLGKGQIPSPHRSGGMSAQGQPQPQPNISRGG